MWKEWRLISSKSDLCPMRELGPRMGKRILMYLIRIGKKKEEWLTGENQVGGKKNWEPLPSKAVDARQQSAKEEGSNGEIFSFCGKTGDHSEGAPPEIVRDQESKKMGP